MSHFNNILFVPLFKMWLEFGSKVYITNGDVQILAHKWFLNHKYMYTIKSYHFYIKNEIRKWPRLIISELYFGEKISIKYVGKWPIVELIHDLLCLNITTSTSKLNLDLDIGMKTTLQANRSSCQKCIWLDGYTVTVKFWKIRITLHRNMLKSSPGTNQYYRR